MSIAPEHEVARHWLNAIAGEVLRKTTTSVRRREHVCAAIEARRH